MLSVAVCAVCVRVTVDRAGVVRVAEVRFVPAAVPPPPHDESATDASTPNAPTATSPASELHEREPPTRSTPRTRRLCGCVLMERGLRSIPVRLSDLAIRSTRRVTRVRAAIRATGLLGSPNRYKVFTRWIALVTADSKPWSSHRRRRRRVRSERSSPTRSPRDRALGRSSSSRRFLRGSWPRTRPRSPRSGSPGPTAI